MAMACLAATSPLAAISFSARRIDDSIANTSMMQSARAPITSCWSPRPIMYFCEAAPAANKASFLVLARSWCSALNGPSRSSAALGPAITSSISFLIAASSGNWPATARFISQPVMINRLISLVPSKIRSTLGRGYAVEAGIAVRALRRILLHVAVSGVDLQHVVHHHVQHLRGPHFEDGALHRVLLDALLDFARGSLGARIHIGEGGIDHADGPVDHGLAGVNSGGGFGQLLLDQAEFGDGLAERLALLGVADAVLEAVARPPHTSRTQLEAPDVQNVKRDMVPLANLAQQVLHRHLAIGQNQGAGGRAADAQLMLFGANRETRRLAFDQEGRKLLAIHLGEYREQIGEAAVGDPHLLAVEDVVLPVGRKHRPRAAVHGIAGGGGFRERIRADPLRSEERRAG